MPCCRSRYVFKAVPNLQHLHYKIKFSNIEPPPVSESLALLPRLRSLHLEQWDTDLGKAHRTIFPISEMLAALPCLTSLRCTHVHIGVQDLIDIAAHATLEHIRVDTECARKDDHSWLGKSVAFNSDEAVAHEEDAATTAEVEYVTVANTVDGRRLCAALERVHPFHHSVQARLRLAHFVHRKLSAWPRPGVKRFHDDRLQQYREQISVLLTLLRKQLAS